MKPVPIFILLNVFLHIFAYPRDNAEKPVRIFQIDDWVSYKNCNYVTSFTESDEYVYFGTSGGIVPYHKYQHFWAEPYTVSDGLADDYITAVLYDHSTGYLWASHRAGISYLDPTADRWENFSNNSLEIFQENTIVRLGTVSAAVCAQSSSGPVKRLDKRFAYLQGIIEDNDLQEVNWQPSRLDPVPHLTNYSINLPYQIDGNGTIFDPNFREYTVNLFYTDKRLDIYGGIWGLGILTGDYNLKILNVHSIGPLQNSVDALWLSDKELITGSLGNNRQSRKGLSVLEFENGRWTYFENLFIPELASSNIFDIFQDNDDRIWIGTDLGLSIYNRKKEEWRRLGVNQGLRDEIIMTIAVDDTLAWIGTPLGLNKICIPTMTVRRVYLTNDRRHMQIFKIKCDDTFVWIGTDNGLYSIDKLTHNVDHYNMNGKKIDIDATTINDVHAIAVSDSITIFSQYNGLLSYEHLNNNFYHNPQFIDSQVLDMDLTSKYLWLGTDNGAYLIRLNDFYLEHYLPIDGLAGYRVNRVRIDGNYVWFGTDRGLSKYNWRKYAF